MRQKQGGFNLLWILVIVVITSVISALTTGVIVYNNNQILGKINHANLSEDENLRQFLEVYANIVSEYYETVDKKELLSKAISAMMNYLGDDYTTHLDDESTNELMNELAGEYKGIGVAINNENKSITKVYPNTPASKVDIKTGDIIIGFNGQNVISMNANEVVNLIKNNQDTFTLTLKRGEKTINVSLKNENILSPSIEYEILPGTNIGYVYIKTFSKTLDIQMKDALNYLEKGGINSLIIDVRDNTGGYLDTATSVISMFLEKGKKIYSLNYKNKNIEYKDETSEHRNYNIIVLTNENSASASEVLAAALKESYGAKIVGKKTFGKGKVQQVMNLEDGSMVKYTSAYWLTPNGTCIDQVGITPDYQIENDNNESNKIDKQLDYAINLLKNN